MKAPTDRATTARVLRDIDVVLRERTAAAAVDRVLTTAGRGCSESVEAYYTVTYPLLGVFDWLGDDCEWCEAEYETVDDIAGLDMYYLDQRRVPGDQRRRYAPEVVSPHLTGGAR